MFVREKIIWENSCGKNLKAGTSSRRERFKGPSCRRGSTIAFPHRGPIGEAEARLKIRLVPPFLALRQQHPRHRASMTLRGTTCFPSTSPRIWEPPEASPLHRGLQSIPGAPGPVAERGGGGVSLAGAPGLLGVTQPAGRCCVYFLLVLFGFCVGGSCEQKGDGESAMQEQSVLSNT